MMRRRLLSTVALGLSGIGGSAWAQSNDAPSVEKAKQEGRVTWYVSIPAPASQPVAERFMQLYPGIRVDVQRLGGFGMWQRLAAEFAAKVNTADVYTQSDFGVRIEAARLGIIAKYAPAITQQYAKEFVDADGYGFSTRIIASAIAYNTDLVTPAQAPKTWADLLDPRWANKKIGTGDPRASGSSNAAYQQMAKTPGLGFEYFEKLARQKPVLFEDSGQQINSLVSGEIPIMVLLDYRPWDFMLKGAPVQVVYPAEGVGWGTDYTHLIARAPHPNAARLLISAES